MSRLLRFKRFEQFLKSNVITKLLSNRDWPEYVGPIRPIYEPEEIQALFKVCDEGERVLYLSYLLTGLRDKEIHYIQFIAEAAVWPTNSMGLFYYRRWEGFGNFEILDENSASLCWWRGWARRSRHNHNPDRPFEVISSALPTTQYNSDDRFSRRSKARESAPIALPEVLRQPVLST